MKFRLPEFAIRILRDQFRWVGLVVAALIIGLGYGLFLNARIQAIQSVSFSDLDRAKNQLAVAEGRRSSLRATKENFEKTFTSTDLARLNRILPTESEFPDLLLFIQAIVESADLELNSLNVVDVSFNAALPTDSTTSSNAAVSSGLSTIKNLKAKDISISVAKATGYDQFKKFLTNIEKSERLVDAVSIMFQNTASTDTSTTLSFILRVYLLPDSTTSS